MFALLLSRAHVGTAVLEALYYSFQVAVGSTRVGVSPGYGTSRNKEEEELEIKVALTYLWE